MTSFMLALDAAFTWVWETSRHATVLIALVLAAQWLGRRWLTPRARYALGLLVLFRLLLPFAPASEFSIFNLGKSFPQRATPRTPGETALPPNVISVTPPLSENISAPFVTQARNQRRYLLQFVKWIWLGVALGSLALVLARQQIFARRVRAFPVITDPRMLALLESCRALMRLRRRVKLVTAVGLNTPAVFGFWHSRLLLPADAAACLAEEELRLVFLHELAHVKRGDILLNWVMILARSIHWFNPLVWLALKRLRADRELACDAMVMDRLSAGERQAYGHTLIKLADTFSASGFCPSLAPVINNKQETKRRIIMITKYQPTTRIALATLALLVISLGCFTFTRAAEKPKTPATTPPQEVSDPVSNRQSEELKQQTENNQRGIKLLEVELAEREGMIRAYQEHLDRLRKELNISTSVAEGGVVTTLDPETMRKLENIKIDSEAVYSRLNTLLEKLRGLSRPQLLSTLPTASPDTILNELLTRKLENERTLVALKTQRTSENPEVKQAQAVQERLDQQIEQRLDGILHGLETMATAARAQAEQAEKQIEIAQQKSIEAHARYAPYFEAKRRLETQMRTRDVIAMKLEQEKIDRTLRSLPPVTY